jgi:hypothetical protein
MSSAVVRSVRTLVTGSLKDLLNDSGTTSSSVVASSCLMANLAAEMKMNSKVCEAHTTRPTAPNKRFFVPNGCPIYFGATVQTSARCRLVYYAFIRFLATNLSRRPLQEITLAIQERSKSMDDVKTLLLEVVRLLVWRSRLTTAADGQLAARTAEGQMLETLRYILNTELYVIEFLSIH